MTTKNSPQVRRATATAAPPAGTDRSAHLITITAVAAAIVLFLPTLHSGFFFDDYYQIALLDGFDRLSDVGPMSLYTFAVGHADRMGDLQGDFLPWWAADDLRLDFWRPLACATLVLDHLLHQRSAVGYHVTNLLLWGALVAAAVWLYREMARASGRGALAVLVVALLYALDDAHTLTILWIANRHAILCTALVTLAIVHYHRWRGRHQVQSLVWAVVSLSGAMLSSELAVAFGGWVLAYEVTLGAGSPGKRARAAALFLCILLIYLVFYMVAGFGAAGSSEYISPLENPVEVAGAATLDRVPALILGAVTPYAAESGGPCPRLAPAKRRVVVGLIAAATMILLTPLLRRDRTARFMGLGALLSMAAQASTAADNRQLLLPTIATAWLLGAYAFDLLAALVSASANLRASRPGAAPCADRRPSTLSSPRLWLGTALALTILMVHAVLAPRTAYDTVKSLTRHAQSMHASALNAEMPTGEANTDARVLLLNTAGATVGPYYLPWIRLIETHHWPAAIWTLAVAPGDRRITRTGPSSFKLEVPPPGYLAGTWERVFRDDFDLPVGTQFRRGVLTTCISNIVNGDILEIEVTLDRDLDDSAVWLLAWNGRNWTRLSAGPIGRPRLLSRTERL